MRYADFKGKIISHLGIGTLHLPEKDGHIDIKETQKIIDYAMNNGITYFELGYVYLNGESETAIRRTLVDKYERESFYLSDKIPSWECTSLERIDEIFNEQLDKVGTDYFDLYLVHDVNENTVEDVESSRVLDYIKGKKASGKVNHIGCSFHAKPALLRDFLLRHDEIEFVQLQLNYMDWFGKSAEELYKIACEFNKPIVIMGPLRGGFLTDSLSNDVKKFLLERKISSQELGLTFVKRLSNVMCILSGVNSLNQLKENIEIFNSSRDDILQDEILDLGLMMQEGALIKCTGCNYCSICPSKIKIPEIFKLYNRNVIEACNTVWEITDEIYDYGYIKDPCIDCKSCEKICPQEIEITKLLRKYM